MEEVDRCKQPRWTYRSGSDRFKQDSVMIYRPKTEQEVMLYQLETAYKPSSQMSCLLWTHTDIQTKENWVKMPLKDH